MYAAEAKPMVVKIATPTGAGKVTDKDLSIEVLGAVLPNAAVPGIFMTSGQIRIVPKFSSINGVLVFDGSLFPICGLLKKPRKLFIEKSRIVEIY